LEIAAESSGISAFWVHLDEEELYIAGVVDVRGGMMTPASQPLVETIDLWGHRNTS